MVEFQEVVRQTERKLELLEQKERLESESKLLKAEIHKLRIIAHNKQADVENMNVPSIKGLFLGITGKKQEILEKEQAEARNAQQNYEYAIARQATVLDKLQKCSEELSAIGCCEEKLRKILSVPEDASVIMLAQCAANLPQLQQYVRDVQGMLIKVLQFGAIRNGTQSTSAQAGTDDQLLAAERKTQNMLIQLKADMKCFAANLASFGIAMDIDCLLKIEDNYLTDLFTYALITSRVEKIAVILRQIGFQMDAIKPRLVQLTLEATRKYLRALLDASHSK